MPHGLSKKFMADLQEGYLAPLLERVKADTSLCLEIRDDYVNLYYRGGNLLKLSKTPTGYQAFFDKKYAPGGAGLPAGGLPKPSVKSGTDVAAWLAVFPALKQAMDFFLGKHPKEEREAQQQMLRDNNFGGVSRATDYFICDIEYANEHGRFDLVAVHWPSTGSDRKKMSGRRLVLIEAKFGEGALAGTAGLHSHVIDINGFIAGAGNLAALKEEMVRVFNQKRELGLVNCGRDLEAFSDEPPMLLLALVNHDPDGTKLREALKTLPKSPHAEVFLATSCFMGYGLFDQAILPIDEARARFGDCI